MLGPQPVRELMPVTDRQAVNVDTFASLNNCRADKARHILFHLPKGWSR